MWGDGSAVERACCSREPKFSSQHPWTGSHLPAFQFHGCDTFMAASGIHRAIGENKTQALKIKGK